MNELRLAPDILRRSASRFPNREAVRDSLRSLTYGGLYEEVRRLAESLIAAGLEKGERCLIVLPNSVSFVVAHFAILEAGGVSVPCEAGAPLSTLSAVVESCRPRFLFTDAKTSSRLADLFSGSFLRLIVIEDEPLKKFLREFPGNGKVYSGSPEDIVALMYTTGATGEPKGVMLSHMNVVMAVSNISEFIGYTEEDREVIVLPLSHNFGLGHLYCNLMNGGSVFLEHGLMRIGRVLDALESFQATGFPGTPLSYAMLLDRYATVLREKGRHLRFIVVNSAALPPQRASQILGLFPKVNLLVYYGLTEASRSTFLSLSENGPDYYRSVGRPMKGIKIRIVDSSGVEVSQGIEGQILISGPTVSPGYWSQPEETSRTFVDNWLHTGDLGRFDERGYLFLSGRIKDVINVGGYKVSPSEVEAVLLRYPGVLDVGVAGVSLQNGESVVAGLVLENGIEVKLEEIHQYCGEFLERYKLPVRCVRLERIPRSETGKIKRKDLIGLLEGEL